MSYNDVSCQWLPLDHPVLENLGNSAVLLVDEAASIPVPQLTALCNQAKHIVLSTTVRGYEGSGRGFITRFLPWLTQHRPDIEHLEMQTPIRWFTDDPVEQFWYHAFCLAPHQPDLSETRQDDFDDNAISYVALNKHSYTGEINRQLLPLLMQAHYQTTADELVRLYDAPNNKTLMAVVGGEVIGVVNYQHEGGQLLSDVAAKIASGARRVNGHLSAQGLSLLLANPDVATANFWRINRIAVLPAYRRRGIATALITRLTLAAKKAGIDALTTSYGATSALIRFWHTNNFLPVRPGLKRDASSGEYSLLMFQPLSERLSIEKSLIAQRFSQELQLHPSPGLFAVTGSPAPFVVNERITKCALTILKQVINGSRSLQHARGSVAWFISTQCNSTVENKSLAVLGEFVKEVNTLSSFTTRYGLTGKRDTEAYITDHLKRLLADDEQ